MTDFETHPVGTAARIEQLEAQATELGDFLAAYMAEAFTAGRTVKELTEAITRANAATAAAYEVAAKVADRYAEYDYCAMNYPEDAGMAASSTSHEIRCEIRALATPDQTSALDKLIAEAVKPYVEALRALIDHTHECERKLTEALYHADFCGESRPLTDARAILAASKKGGA